MREKICSVCRNEGRKTCLIRTEFRILQDQVPEQVISDDDLKKITELNLREKHLHELARERGCMYHNDYTLILPKFERY